MTISALTGEPITQARARATHPATSHAAAARVDVTKGQQQALRALRFIERGGQVGATGDQIRDAIRRAGFMASDSGPRSRCRECVSLGLMRVSRRAGQHAVFTFTDAGRAKAEELWRIAKAERERERQLTLDTGKVAA